MPYCVASSCRADHEAPTQSGWPISQWTAREVVDEITGRGIVEALARRHAAQLLNRGIFIPTWGAVKQ